MTLSSALNAVLTWFRTLDRGRLLLRSVIMIAGVLALAVTVAQAWPTQLLFTGVAAVALVLSAVAPQQLVAPVFSAAVVIIWVLRSSGEVTVSTVVVALLLLVIMLACALDGTGPHGASLPDGGVRAFGLAAVIMGAVVIVVAGVLGLVGRGSVPSLLPVSVAAFFLVPAGAWVAYRGRRRRS